MWLTIIRYENEWKISEKKQQLCIENLIPDTLNIQEKKGCGKSNEEFKQG